MLQGDKQAACTVLSSLPEKDRNRQGVVSALVALHVALGDRLAASKVLREAVQWHQNNKVSSAYGSMSIMEFWILNFNIFPLDSDFFFLQTSASQLGELWRHAADFHLRTGDAATAAGSLLELHKLNPHDTTTLAQLITAYARVSYVSLSKEIIYTAVLLVFKLIRQRAVRIPEFSGYARDFHKMVLN